jgi:hypothetical protein
MNRTAIELQNSNPKLDPAKGPTCPCCQAHSQLVPASDIYTGRPDLDFNMWYCKSCDTYVGTHKTGPWRDFPMGSLADAQLRNLRKQCHTLFDHKWKEKQMNRKAMYVWLQQQMGLAEPDAHIGELNANQCLTLIGKLNSLYK